MEEVSGQTFTLLTVPVISPCLKGVLYPTKKEIINNALSNMHSEKAYNFFQ